MRVADVMSRHVITIAVDSQVAVARERLAGHRIRQLPVIKNGRVAGVVAERDLTGVADDVPVADVMTRSVVTIAPSATLRAAAAKINGHDAACLVVVEDGNLAGVITPSDLVRALAKGATHVAPQSERLVLRSRGPREAPHRRP